jgi:membrane-associated phospholipid phosphatase
LSLDASPTLVTPSAVAPLSSRGIGEAAAAGSLPDAVVTLFWVLTELGNPWVCLVAVAAAYVVGRRSGLSRPAAAFVLGLALCALGLVLGLKHLFALPRPPGAAADGYGFPSGHALGATVFWGGVALLAERGSRRLRLGVASAVVLLVAASRVVVGVHYLVDVVAGTVLGVALLAAVFAAGPGFPRAGAGRGAAPTVDARHAGAAFLAAAAVAAVGLLAVAPGNAELLLALGTSLGASLAWRPLGESLPRGTRSPGATVAGVLALPVPLVAIRGAAELAVPDVLTVVVAGAGAALLLAIPSAAAGLAERI